MSMEAQLQMRHNVEEMHSAFRDLTDWASDIESKDRALRGIEPKRTKRGGGRDQAELEEEEEAREIAEAKAELAQLALEEPRRGAIAAADAALSGCGAAASTAMAVSGLSGGSGAPSACGPTNFDKWRRFDADSAVDALERREAEREALRLKLTRLENGRAQAALRRRQLAAEAEAEALKARGNACFGSARYEDAVADYTEALESTPRSATLYANRAMALLKLRAFTEAEEDASAALGIDPAHVKARLRRAHARVEMAKYDEALEDLEMALEAEPKNASARRQMTECRTLRSKQAEARRPKPGVRVEVFTVQHDADNDADPFVLSITAHAPPAQAHGGDGSAEAAPAAPATAPAPPRTLRPAGASLPCPSSGADVERAWRTLRKHDDEWRAYVRRLPPARLETVFASSLPADMLSAMLAALAHTAAEGADAATHAFGLLRAMSVAGRFSILAMCMDKADARHAAAAFDALEGFASVGALAGVTTDQVLSLRAKYE